MRILVTGATGYIGKNFIKSISKNPKYKLFITVRKKLSKNHEFNKFMNLKVITIDLSDFKKLDLTFKNLKIDIIFHFAWNGVANFDRNKNDQIINMVYSSNLALICTKYNIQKFIGIGSQAEYGPQNKVLSENSPTRPTTLYGQMKLNTFLTLKDHFKNSKTHFTWLRLFSCFGPGDHEYWFMNYLITNLLKDKNVNITKCEQKWDYLFIEDLVTLLSKFISTKNAATLYNVGSGEVHKLKNIVEYIKKNIDTKSQVNFGAVPYRSDQVMKLIPNVDLVKKDMRWKPKNTTYQGITKTINWYKDKYEN